MFASDVCGLDRSTVELVDAACRPARCLSLGVRGGRRRQRRIGIALLDSRASSPPLKIDGRQRQNKRKSGSEHRGCL